jgi:hypothetical protein
MKINLPPFVIKQGIIFFSKYLVLSTVILLDFGPKQGINLFEKIRNMQNYAQLIYT